MGFNGQKFFHLTEEDGLAGSTPLSFEEDNEGNLWISCQGQGVSIYDGKKFTNYNISDSVGLNSNNIMCMHQHSNGDFFLGTFQGGLHRFRDGKFEVIGDSSTVIYDFLEDTKGNLWFGTKSNGLGKYNGEEITYFGTEKEFKKRIILDLEFDKDSSILVPCPNGLYRFNSDETIDRFGVNEGFPAEYKAEKCLVLQNGDYLLSISTEPYLYSKGILQSLNLNGDSKDGLPVWLKTNQEMYGYPQTVSV
jgi:ligand-binding sensor domain-containing protein